MTLLAGIDIGGTTCAVSLGILNTGNIEMIEKIGFPTPNTPHQAIDHMIHTLDQLMDSRLITSPLSAIGISCGGPLDSQRGIILSPPNLLGWDNIHIVSLLKEQYDVPVAIQNDANAGAIAEWKWGAGRGAKNMIFLTFGTGMGAGLILNDQLYSGTNDLAGEVGHVRLEDDGPVGFGKTGSFEGFCSGGGIAQLATTKAKEAINQGRSPLYCPTTDDLHEITTKKVGEAAQAGDQTGLEVFSVVGYQLGRGLAILIDILNPEKIIIGSIYGRQQKILEPLVLRELKKEAIGLSLDACEILPAGLGEKIGDYASFSVGLLAYENKGGK